MDDDTDTGLPNADDVPIIWEDDCKELLDLECTEEARVSLHTMSGTKGACTVKVHGTLRGNTINILIDSGSTHNFISQHLTKQPKLATQPCSPFFITVANGAKLQCVSMLHGVKW